MIKEINSLVKKKNLSQKELDEAKRLSNLPTKIKKKNYLSFEILRLQD